jgi:hypothetical protein
MNVDEFVKGSIDMHLHPGIAGGISRVDVMEAAGQAQQAGMKALVYKSHNFSAAMAAQVDSMFPDIKIVGSICLDYEIGGINIQAVDNAVMLGAKVVWMPTFSSSNSINMMRKQGFPMRGEGFSIIDGSGNLLPELLPILAIIKEKDMVLATGHISTEGNFRR